MMSRKIIAIIAIALVVLAMVRLRTRDISEQISSAENAVLAVLQAHGMTDNDVLFREQSSWKRSGIRGKSINYVVNLRAWASSNELAEEIKKKLRDTNGVNLSKVYFRRDKDKKGTAYFEIAFKGNIILLFTVENVSAGWVKSESEETLTPKLALVLDDFGYTGKNLDDLKELGVPLTIAVLPNAPFSKKVSFFAEDNGVEVILHLPLEPDRKNVQLEEGTIMVGMEEGAIKNTMSRSLKTVPTASGVSNHQGSKATGDKETMEIVLGEVKKNGLYYLDSMTTSGSVCEKIAGEKGLTFAKRDVFLDMDLDEGHIKRQLEKAENVARAKGYAVAIGHEREATLKVLKEMIPEMKDRGIQFVGLSEIIELESAGQGSK
ncbi:MAG: divergent polysaccharide deacetylase family protein [Candidatus Omnitrophota bacterium]